MPVVARDDLHQRIPPGDGKPRTTGPALLVLRHPWPRAGTTARGPCPRRPRAVRVAEAALAGCVLDRQVTGLLTDASLCHGWAGVVQALRRAACDALSPRPLQDALRTARRGMEDQNVRHTNTVRPRR
jgi:hypothetical protein